MSSRSLMSACVGRVSNPAKAERSSASVSAGGESFDPSAYFANAWATHASSHSWACDTLRTNRSSLQATELDCDPDEFHFCRKPTHRKARDALIDKSEGSIRNR
jgi:hypothetical protein